MAFHSKSNMICAWAAVRADNSSLYESYNVSSISDSGSGRQKLNLTTAVTSNTYGILGTATCGSGAHNYQNRGQIITCFQTTSSSSSAVPYAIEYSGNNGAGATSHITIMVVGRL